MKFRSKFAALTLLCLCFVSLPAFADLTFFWRAEGTTLDPTDDFSAGDTTATANNSPAISATGARVGSNGMVFDGVSERYDFNPASILTPGEGAVGGWFQFPSVFPGTGSANVFLVRGTNSNDYVRITTQSVVSERRLTFVIRNNGGSDLTLQMSAGNLTAGNWYFFVGRWNSSIDYRSIAAYDTTMTLVNETIDNTTDFTANVPADFASTSGLRLGDTTGTTGTLYIDNVFAASNYDEPIQDNATITSYTAYDAGGGTSGLLLRRRRN